MGESIYWKVSTALLAITVIVLLVAIILESNSLNDTKRWLNGLKKQRKHADDLPVYVYPESRNFSEYLRLKSFCNKYENVFSIQGANDSVVSEVLKRRQIKYLIDIKDHQFMGVDFADYYFFGKNVLKNDTKIPCICGGTKDETDLYFLPGTGDVFWLMENGEMCDLGEMQHRREYEGDSPLFTESICLRPETSRVSNKENHVTRMSWNVAKYDPSLYTLIKFKERVWNDLHSSNPKAKVEWEDLKRMDENEIYTFPYETENDLTHYLEENVSDVMKIRKYEDIVPLYVENRKVYIVDEERYQKILIEKNKK
uniref:Uncharacterized protein n=1 Tax=Caenorhabditis japonica TaxID=281687 RepID=A0A8R1HMB0_CAEJA